MGVHRPVAGAWIQVGRIGGEDDVADRCGNGNGISRASA
jgi:hypothetical protein